VKEHPYRTAAIILKSKRKQTWEQKINRLMWKYYIWKVGYFKRRVCRCFRCNKVYYYMNIYKSIDSNSIMMARNFAIHERNCEILQEEKNNPNNLRQEIKKLQEQINALKNTISNPAQNKKINLIQQTINDIRVYMGQ